MAQIEFSDEQAMLLETGFQNSEEPYQLNRHQLDAVVGDAVVSLDTRQEQMISDYVSGISGSKGNIPVSSVPWHVWGKPLLGFWIPFLSIVVLAYCSLALVLKRHWIEHEHLSFPIARFAESIMPDEKGKVGELFRKPAFWWASATSRTSTTPIVSAGAPVRRSPLTS